MRTLLVALLLVWMPAAVAAQTPSALQQAGAWGQQLGAAQQPMTDAYTGCSPIVQRAQAALQAQSVEQIRAILTGDEYRACLDRMRDGGRVARDRMAAVGPMPVALERLLHIDSRDTLRRALASTDGMIAYIETMNEALDALAAGNVPLMQRKIQESRALAGSMLEGQIVLLETLRAGMPLQFHRSMMDLRLGLTRGMRVLVIADPASEGGEASAGLRAEATRIRLAALALRANWRRESIGMRAAISRLHDQGRAAILDELDQGIEQTAAAGISLGTSLEAFPAGRLDAAASVNALRQLADTELVVMNLVQRFAVAASRLG